MNIAAVFPGQGSQSVGMLSELYTRFNEVKDTFTQASEVLGYDCWKLIQEGPEKTLNQTEYTQPLMYISDIAVWRVWQAAGGSDISIMAGHSLGEYVALTASGLFDFTEAVSLIAERGRLMATAVPVGEGGMAAILGLEDDAISKLCQSLSGQRIVEAVNFNAPGQVVISGHLDAVEKVVHAAKNIGARKALILPVSVPNHSSLMNSVAKPLAKRIEAMNTGHMKVPVIQNLQARSYESLSATLDALKRHVCSPVYWADSVQALKRLDVDLVIEMGPGKVLSGLNRRINKSLKSTFIQDIDSLQKSIELCKYKVA